MTSPGWAGWQVNEAAAMRELPGSSVLQLLQLPNLVVNRDLGVDPVESQQVDRFDTQVSEVQLCLLAGLKRRRLWPRCQHRAVVDTADETAKLAGECAIIWRAVALARWVGPEGKALTGVGVLRKPAVPGACAAIGIRPRSRRHVRRQPRLHR
jgi:hypothetical protein